MPTFTDDDLDAAQAEARQEAAKRDGKLPEFPADGASDPQRRDWLEHAFSVPAGSSIGKVIRYGADDVTPMTVEILPGTGKPRLVRFDEERQAAKHGTLRAALTRDAGLRGQHITGPKIAGDAYYLLCQLATVIGSNDPRDKAQEWISGYREEAKRVKCSLAKSDLYVTLDSLRSYPYSKRQINLWLATVERRGIEAAGEPPQPPLLIDGKKGEWTSITHMATYVRWGRDQPGVIDPTALAGLIVELGGERQKLQAWDTTTRQRQDHIVTVMVRFPPVGEEEAE